ncbi:hypothetical protein H0E84_08600 [Luteimonas sp. SJ-92]|uniref:TonB-dependent receptor-like beta-barrel domain-containing protein n=1 Tax=Luteimonas salinisoli TaxID=2752307 RepID=A0A853JCG8_9GAMM|nr:TonB-dependent receptor [Luteimonas salinisoli]NZA26444.1 hypothetical protein [Luteimonas salinisoli]
MSNCKAMPTTTRGSAIRRTAGIFALSGALAGTATLAPARAQDDVISEADDAFGSRIGVESIGLYSESLVRGFNLQQAGNYRIGGAYFVRAAAPPDTIVAGSQIRVGPSALALDFPAPSGVVEYRLLDDARERRSLELGFQHLLDANPRPYARAFFTRRSRDGRASLSGGALGSPSARYYYGNEARYGGLGLVPRMALGERWQATAFHGSYRQRYQADVGYQAAGAHPLPRIDRSRYPGQDWSRYDTRNTTTGAILTTQPRAGAWDMSLSAIDSRVDRPRSDFNLFREVDADGGATATTIVAHDRRLRARAYEASARRDWSRDQRRDELVVTLRGRRSHYHGPRVRTVVLGHTSLSGPPPRMADPGDWGGEAGSTAAIGQEEAGIGWHHLRASGMAANLGLRRVRLDESSLAADGARTSRSSSQWLYNAAVVLPLAERLTAFASTTRAIEEAGAAPEHARNRFQILPPALARQVEVGTKWQAAGGLAVIGALFEISKPEPGFDADGTYRLLTEVRHRGAELSVAGDIGGGLNVVAGLSWLQPRLRGELVDAGTTGRRPVGRSSRLALASFRYQPPGWDGFSVDADAAHHGEAPADPFGRTRVPARTIVNAGARYRHVAGGVPVLWRLRIYNATDRFAWSAGSSGIQTWEPGRRIMLSMTLGE